MTSRPEDENPAPPMAESTKIIIAMVLIAAALAFGYWYYQATHYGRNPECYEISNWSRVDDCKAEMAIHRIQGY